MARRNGRKGAWLATDDLTGFTQYGNRLREGYYGELAVKPLLRNLQEIATPLTDPQPLPFYRGPNYEVVDPCSIELAPLYVGNTTIPTSKNNAGMQALGLFPVIPNLSIGCTFIVQ